MLRSTQHNIEGLKVKSNPEVMKDFFKRIQKITIKEKIDTLTSLKLRTSEEALGENEYMCMYGWVPSLFLFTTATFLIDYQFSSVAQSCPTLCNPMDCSMPGFLVLPCLLEFTQTHVHQWCHPTISSSIAPFSSCLQYFPASWSFLMSQLFVSGGRSVGASA